MSNAKSILEKNESFKKRSLDEISIGVPYKKGQLTFIQKNNSELDVIKKGKKPLNINIKFPGENFFNPSIGEKSWVDSYLHSIKKIEDHLQRMNIYNTELEFIGIGDKIYIVKGVTNITKRGANAPLFYVCTCFIIPVPYNIDQYITKTI